MNVVGFELNVVFSIVTSVSGLMRNIFLSDKDDFFVNDVYNSYDVYIHDYVLLLFRCALAKIVNAKTIGD